MHSISCFNGDHLISPYIPSVRPPSLYISLYFHFLDSTCSHTIFLLAECVHLIQVCTNTSFPDMSLYFLVASEDEIYTLFLHQKDCSQWIYSEAQWLKQNAEIKSNCKNSYRWKLRQSTHSNTNRFECSYFPMFVRLHLNDSLYTHENMQTSYMILSLIVNVTLSLSLLSLPISESLSSLSIALFPLIFTLHHSQPALHHTTLPFLRH